jgi:hypothetical protein
MISNVAAASMPFVLEHPEYGFYLSGDWRQVSTDDRLLELQSDYTQSRITLSIMPMEIAEDGLDAWADKLLLMRRQAHEAWLTLPENLGKGRTFTMVHEQKRHFPELKSTEVSYTGQYSGVSLFGFVGFVTVRKVVSMFCETKMSFAPGRAGVFQAVANGFKNTLP